jgi:membrane-associated protease RseP (regulator of RpoE activity)
MVFRLLLLLVPIALGLLTYFILQRTATRITRTPVWILWLVVMAPLLWGVWLLSYSQNQSLPAAVLLGPFVVCFFLYWVLIFLGRTGTADKPVPPSDAASESGLPPNASQPSQAPPLRPINQAEETQLRNCFPANIYALQQLEYRPQAVICLGQLRSNPEEAYRTVEKNIQAQFGDRFLVLFRENLNGKPFFAMVPNPYRAPDSVGEVEPLARPGLATGLLLITLFTTAVAGAQMAGVSRSALQSDSSLLLKGLPYALALMAVLGVHELGHYFTARFYKLRTTLPYFIPVPFFLGTFGAFIQIRSPLPHRKALFDVGIAGPAAGLVVTVPLLLWGLANSAVVDLPAKSGLLTLDALNPSFSLLLTLLSKLMLGGALTAGKAIHLHPVAVAGYVGLVVTAYNLMPVGQLDGGHIVHAMFGQRTSLLIGQMTRFLMLALSLIRSELMFWALLLFLMPITDEPALNDVSELDNQRDFWGLMSLALLVAIMLPAPEMLIKWLNL